MRNSAKLTTYLLMVGLLALFSLTGCGGSNEPTGPAAENLAKGIAFMEQNSKRAGVISLDNGLQYEVITKGSGKTPKLTDFVVVHQRGKHLDGTTFSDSYKDGKPEEALVKHTIPGWKKILPMMSVGDKWIVYLPPHMAFSNRGEQGVIEPNETLIYEIELLEIKW
jgi:FKBP-type peptidyl-prolyl cis-trans isomerase FklB